EEMRPGEFHPEKAEALGVPRGPLWARLQGGEIVQAADGKDVRPDEVLGPPRLGRKFSFVTDSLAFPEISGDVVESDLFVCEGMFEKALEETAREKKHMTAEQAANIALAARVKKLALIHYSPRYTDFELKQLLREAQAVFPKTVLSRDRAVFPIEFPDALP
ncbi:MAG: ribonuclease Z, partial [Treponema sp.]|nr:ribonuclease Z [Treponema sp.]